MMSNSESQEGFILHSRDIPVSYNLKLSTIYVEMAIIMMPNSESQEGFIISP